MDKLDFMINAINFIIVLQKKKNIFRSFRTLAFVCLLYKDIPLNYNNLHVTSKIFLFHTMIPTP